MSLAVARIQKAQVNQMKPTPLTDQNFISVLAVAAEDCVVSSHCECGELDETCFRCEVIASIERAKAV